jgi:hypothetical protein
VKNLIQIHTEPQLTVSRSFRIGEEWEKILQEDAEAQGTSVNALLNNILKRYSVLRVSSEYHAISLPSEMFMSLILKGSDLETAEIGKNYGDSARELFLRWGFPLDYSSVVWVIEYLFQEIFQWYICAHHTQGDQDVFHLSHGYGQNWSVYLSNFFSSLFDIILNIKIDVEVSDSSATFFVKTPAWK